MCRLIELHPTRRVSRVEVIQDRAVQIIVLTVRHIVLIEPQTSRLCLDSGATVFSQLVAPLRPRYRGLLIVERRAPPAFAPFFRHMAVEDVYRAELFSGGLVQIQHRLKPRRLLRPLDIDSPVGVINGPICPLRLSVTGHSLVLRRLFIQVP